MSGSTTKSILLVEDDRFLGDLYAKTFDEAGYAVHRAYDAQSAVDILDEYGCDLIVLDLMLPAHNGVEVLQEIQSYSDWQDLPVLIVSAQQPSAEFNEQHWAKYGVKEYIYKPQVLPMDIVQAAARYI